jgi:precorrin-6A synthase
VRRLLIIGIGAGDPEQVTVQAIKALNRADVFFVVDKGADKQDLMTARQEICERYIENRPYRMVSIPEPERDRAAPAYRQAVEEWRAERAGIWASVIRDELADGGCGALLVWGDPALYDSVLAIVEQVISISGMNLELEVIPGISSVQALAARHRVSLTQVGRRHAGPMRRRGRDAGRILLVHCRRSRYADLLGRLPRHQGRDPAVRDRARGRRPDPGRPGRSAGAQGLDHGHLPAAPPPGSGPVNVGAVVDPEHNDALFLLVDLIEHPVRTGPGEPDTGQLAP